MEQPTNQPKDTPAAPQAPPARAGSTFKNILIGLFIGILVGIAGLLYYQGHLTQIMRALYTATWVVFGVVILTFIIFWGLREYVTRYIFGSRTASARDVLDEAQQASDLLTGSLADRLLTDVPAEQRDRIKHLLPRLANWLLWGRLRNWWWQWILGIFVSLGGITGTMLLMNQNELLNNQNSLIQRQMSLEEAGRRGALVVLMSNIMDKVDREIEEQKRANPRDSLFRLSQSLIGQIAALSHSFKPYRYLDGDTLIARPLSPERGQLLITITRLPLDSITLSKIYDATTFNNADLQEVVLSRAYLNRASLWGADLSGAYLDGADLRGAHLNRADLRGVYLDRADLREAYMSEAHLNRAELDNADLRGAELDYADLRGADLSGANLREAILWKADLTGTEFGMAKLEGAKLERAKLEEAGLSQADLSQADLSGVDLRGADMRYTILREADMVKAILHKAYMSGADLRGANLREADLRGANLWEADLSETDLRWANLGRVDFTIAQAQTVKSLYGCQNLHDSIRIPLLKTHPHLFEEKWY